MHPSVKGAFTGAAGPAAFIAIGAALDKTGLFQENLMMGTAHISLLFHALSAKSAYANKKSEIYTPPAFSSEARSNGVHYKGHTGRYDKIYFDRNGRMAGAAVALLGHVTLLANLPK